MIDVLGLHGVLGLFGALVDLSRPGHYLHWGFIQLSAANGIVIALMVVVFVVAVLVPFRTGRGEQ